MAAVFLSSCMTTAPTEPATGRMSENSSPRPGAGAKTSAGAPELPSNYRSRAAIYIVSEYIKDASGPPEISEPVSHSGPFGGSTQAVIRFPVSTQVAAKTNVIALAGGSGPYYRCASISAYSGISSLSKTELSVRSAKIDTPECSLTLKYTRYSELENLAAQCRIPGAPCQGDTIVTYTFREKKGQ